MCVTNRLNQIIIIATLTLLFSNSQNPFTKHDGNDVRPNSTLSI